MFNIFAFSPTGFSAGSAFCPRLTPEPQAPSKTSCKIRSISCQTCTDLVQKHEEIQQTLLLLVIFSKKPVLILLGPKKELWEEVTFVCMIILKKHARAASGSSGSIIDSKVDYRSFAGDENPPKNQHYLAIQTPPEKVLGPKNIPKTPSQQVFG